MRMPQLYSDEAAKTELRSNYTPRLLQLFPWFQQPLMTFGKASRAYQIGSRSGRSAPEIRIADWEVRLSSVYLPCQNRPGSGLLGKFLVRALHETPPPHCGNCQTYDKSHRLCQILHPHYRESSPSSASAIAGLWQSIKALFDSWRLLGR